MHPRGRMLRRAGLLAFFTLLAALLARPTIVRADDAAQARFHDALAREHYAARRYEAALREFFLEQRVAANVRIVFNIALCFEQLHRDEEAYAFFTEYMGSAGRDPEGERYAQAALARIEPRIARIHVTSEPPGARIYLDRTELGDYGRTESTIAAPAGTPTLTVQLDGYEPQSREVRTTVGRQVDAHFVLVRILGELAVETSGQIEGATATVRDDEGHVAAQGAVPLRASVPPGRYEIEVAAEGRAPFRALRTVTAQQTTTLATMLEPLPVPSGLITVTSNVEGALVRVDGEGAGFTPLSLSVPEGEHRVEVLGEDGLDPWGDRVRIQANERAWVTVTLEPPVIRRRSDLTWVVGLAGITLAVGGAVIATAALTTHLQWREERDAGHATADLYQTGRSLNLIADALFVSGGLLIGSAALLYVATDASENRRSSANVSRGAQ